MTSERSIAQRANMSIAQTISRRGDRDDLPSILVGLTFKQYDRYLQFRMSLPPSDARRRALEDAR